ncbi:uncharacterized protein ACIBXB_003354 isoform 1-T1 [Morphnus guianensis]
MARGACCPPGPPRPAQQGCSNSPAPLPGRLCWQRRRLPPRLAAEAARHQGQRAGRGPAALRGDGEHQWGCGVWHPCTAGGHGRINCGGSSFLAEHWVRAWSGLFPDVGLKQKVFPVHPLAPLPGPQVCSRHGRDGQGLVLVPCPLSLWQHPPSPWPFSGQQLARECLAPSWAVAASPHRERGLAELCCPGRRRALRQLLCPPAAEGPGPAWPRAPVASSWHATTGLSPAASCCPGAAGCSQSGARRGIPVAAGTCMCLGRPCSLPYPAQGRCLHCPGRDAPARVRGRLFSLADELQCRFSHARPCSARWQLHFCLQGAGAAACGALHPLPSALLPLAPACPSSIGSGPSRHHCHSPPQRPVCLQGRFCPSRSVWVLVQVTPAATWQHVWLGMHAPGWPQPRQANGELPLPFPRGLALQPGQLCWGPGDAPSPVGAARCPSHPQEAARAEKSLLEFPGKLRHVGPASRIEVAEVEGELQQLAGRLEGARSLGMEGLGPQLQPFLCAAEEELRGAWDALERMHRATATTLDFFCEDTAPGGLQDLCAILHGFAGRLLTAAQENRVREQAQHRRQQLERERLKRRSIATCSAWDVAPREVGPCGPFPLTPQPGWHGLRSPRPSSEPCLAAPRGDDPLGSPGPPGCGSPRLPPALQSPTWPPRAPLAPLRRHTAPALPALPEVGGCDQPSPDAPASRQGGLFESCPELCPPEPPPPATASAPASPTPFFSLASLFQRSRAQSRSACPQLPPAAPPEGSALLGFLRRLVGGKGHGAPPS